MSGKREMTAERPGLETAVVGPTGRPLRTFPVPKPLKSHGPARIISLCNQKGGVGKTTTTINLGAALAEYGRKVLAVDFDPQGALSAGLGVRTHDVPTIYDLLLGTVKDPSEVIADTAFPNLDVIPANIDLSAAEVHLVNEVAREQILARVLRQVSSDYDVILIDCQPSLGLLTVNALTAAHGVLIPLECEFFALRGVALLVETIDKVKDRLNPAHRARRHPRHHVRLAHAALARGARARRRDLRRPGARDGHRPHGEVPRRERRRAADHLVRARARRPPRPTVSSRES